MSISDFFQNTLGSHLSNVRWSWGATNPLTNQLFLRVWKDQLEVVGGIERIHILKNDWDGSSAGFAERARHVELLKNGVEGFGVLCEAKDLRAVTSRTILRFNDTELLQLGDVIEEDGNLYAIITGRISADSLVQISTANSSLLPDLKSIQALSVLTTTKELLAQARVGQGVFRSQVLKLWGHKCCVTSTLILDAVRASHIKPWRHSSDNERLDPYNGLPLVATLDALFDAGLITFSGSGEMLLSRRISEAEKSRLNLSGLQLIKPPLQKTLEYLEFHRDVRYLN